MIDYIEIVNKIKNVKEEAIEDFNKKVSIPLILSNLDSQVITNGDCIIIEKNDYKYELDIETRKAFAEMLAFLKKIDSNLYNKIEYKYIDFFEKFKDIKYTFSIEDKIENIEFKYLTLEILTIFNLKFWCLEEERKGFLDNLKKTDKNLKLKKAEKDISNVENKIEQTQIVKQNWWNKLLNKLRKIKKN